MIKSAFRISKTKIGNRLSKEDVNMLMIDDDSTALMFVSSQNTHHSQT